MVTAGGKVIWGRYAQITVRFSSSLPPVPPLFPHHKCIGANNYPPQEQLRNGRLRQRSPARMKHTSCYRRAMYFPQIGCSRRTMASQAVESGTKCILLAADDDRRRRYRYPQQYILYIIRDKGTDAFVTRVS